MTQQHNDHRIEIPGAISHPLTLGGTAFAVVETTLAHTGPGSLILSLAAAGVVVAARKMLGESEEDAATTVLAPQESPTLARVVDQPQPKRKRSFLDRATGAYHEETLEQRPQPLEEVCADDTRVIEEMEPLYPRDVAPSLRAPFLSVAVQEREPSVPAPLSPAARRQIVTFSSLLQSSRFVPSSEQIYLGERDGSPVFSSVKKMQHVAVAGKTGNGKSSIERLLLAQLCYVGTTVLLLNPHYTRYDLETEEDWTPFEPFLANDPMQCVGDYGTIEHYLKWAAEDELPRRISMRANSIWWGDPIYLVIDELPSVIRKIPNAAEYMRKLLEEGRKVGIFLMSASHNFMVKTISPKDGGGSIRTCYNLIYYAGGDSITVTELLNIDNRQVPENALGRGSIMLRCGTHPDVQEPARCTVSYLDNAALYMMLGPSTYDPRAAQAQAERLSAPIPAYAGAPVPQVARYEQQAFQVAAAPVSSAPAPRAAAQVVERPQPRQSVAPATATYSREHLARVQETSVQRIARRRGAVLGDGKVTHLLDEQEEIAVMRPAAPAQSSRKGVHSRIAKRRVLSAQEDPFLMLVLQLYQDGITSKRAIAQKLTEDGQPTSPDTANNALCDLEDLEEIPRRQRY